MRKLWLFGLVVMLGINVAFSQSAHGQDEAAVSSIGVSWMSVEAQSQLHTQQIFGSDATALLNKVDAEVARVEGRLVKLHVVAIDNAIVDALRAAIAARNTAAQPVVTCVVGKLADAEAKLGIDAVIALPLAKTDRAQASAEARVIDDRFGRILTPGSRLYISGQAEKGSTPAEATRLTMESLKRTLQWLGSSLDDIAQAKAFVTPIASADEVRAEFAKFVGDRKIPLVLVEWSSTLPIEIELVSATPTPAVATAAVEYLTPPGMSASPVYCRVARVNAPETIYIGGLFAPKAESAEQEVRQLFGELQNVLALSRSDLQHLVKATYYVVSPEASTQLNVLRPQFYDASRPPAASKAVVAGVGRVDCNLTMDMIAVRSHK